MKLTVMLLLILKIEEQQRKALAEDPNVFDYDGCYDEMKQKSVRRKVQDRADTQVYVKLIIIIQSFFNLALFYAVC